MNNHFDSKGGGQNIAQGDHAIGKQVNITQEVRGDGNIFSATGNVTVNQGLSMDDAIKLAKELAAGQLAAKDEQIKALTEAIAALSKTGAPAASINDAVQALKQGDTAKAQAVFAEVAAAKEAAGKKSSQEAAEAYRHLGALAYLHDTNGALTAYRKAVELDPDNADGWNQLGHLLRRTGELAQAEAAYRKVLSLSEAHQDKKEQSAALGNLGNVCRTRGDLDKAEEMYRKALELHEALGSKQGMAQDYGNLGIMYGTRGDLDKAEEMFRKSLALHEALGSKEGMANQYGNLGSVHKQRGDLAQAEAAWRKSLRLYQEMGHPGAKKVQLLLDELAKQGQPSLLRHEPPRSSRMTGVIRFI